MLPQCNAQELALHGGQAYARCRWIFLLCSMLRRRQVVGGQDESGHDTWGTLLGRPRLAWLVPERFDQQAHAAGRSNPG